MAKMNNYLLFLTLPIILLLSGGTPCLGESEMLGTENAEIMENQRIGDAMLARFLAALESDTISADKKTEAVEALVLSSDQQQLHETKRETLPGDRVRRCCTRVISDTVQSRQYQIYKACPKSSYRTWYSSCGWFNLDRCRRYRTTYWTVTCTEHRTLYHTVHNECPARFIACCNNLVYLPENTYNGVYFTESCIPRKVFNQIIKAVIG